MIWLAAMLLIALPACGSVAREDSGPDASTDTVDERACTYESPEGGIDGIGYCPVNTSCLLVDLCNVIHCFALADGGVYGAESLHTCPDN